MPIKILHTADIHLGMAHKGLPGEAAKTRKQEHRQTFLDIISLADNEDVDFLLIAGDLFEHSYADKNTVDFIARGFASLKRAQVIITPGNHDPKIPYSYYNSFTWPPNVHIFGAQWERLNFNGLNAAVYGYGFESYNISQNVLSQFPYADQMDSEKVNIVVFHGSDTSVTAAKDNQYAPFGLEDVSRLNADYLALGHYHRMRKVWDRCYYSGCPEPGGFDEEGEKGVIIASVDKASVKADFVSLAKRQYHNIAIDITGAKDVFEVIDMIKDSIEDRHLYKITLEGVISPDISISEQEITDAAGACFYLSVENKTLPEYDLEVLKQGKDAVAIYIKEMEHLIEGGSEEEKQVYTRALYMGLDALIRGEVILR